MSLKLSRPLVVFDLETTGLDITKDRIIQMSYIKVRPDGHEERETLFVNPQRGIPAVVTRLTGIGDSDVSGAPTFKELVPKICNIFGGSDIAGYNSNSFDVPILAEEMARAGSDFDLSQCRLIDAMTIYRKMERRNLAAAYKFYCGREMSDDFEPHRADQDTEATYRVLLGQVDMYSAERQSEPSRILANDVATLADFCRSDNADFAGRIVWKSVTVPAKDADGNDAGVRTERREVFNFGRYKGMEVAEVLRKDPGYYGWMMSGDFAQNTKQVLTRIRLREMAKNKK